VKRLSYQHFINLFKIRVIIKLLSINSKIIIIILIMLIKIHITNKILALSILHSNLPGFMGFVIEMLNTIYNL